MGRGKKEKRVVGLGWVGLCCVVMSGEG